MAAAKAKAAELRTALDAYEKLGERRIAELRASVETSSLREGEKREFLEGFDEGAAKARAEGRDKEMIDMEREAIDGVDTLLAFLSEKRGRWRPAGDVFQFDNAADLKVFDKQVTHLRMLATLQNERQQNFRDRVLGPQTPTSPGSAPVRR